MGKLVAGNDIALFEYPQGADKPKFSLDDNGCLFIQGYSIEFPWTDKKVGVAKRYKLGLIGYEVVGKYKPTKKNSEYKILADDGEVDINNCVMLKKKQ